MLERVGRVLGSYERIIFSRGGVYGLWFRV